jgi:hypothetical protein
VGINCLIISRAVEAGKKAAAKVLDLQTRAVEALRNQPVRR